MEIYYSFIIPVYNRPDEIQELLSSMKKLNFSKPFEIVIIEDGSNKPAKDVVVAFQDRLNISYFFKENYRN